LTLAVLTAGYFLACLIIALTTEQTAELVNVTAIRRRLALVFLSRRDRADDAQTPLVSP
jgi:hypothetical protein